MGKEHRSRSDRDTCHHDHLHGDPFATPRGELVGLQSLTLALGSFFEVVQSKQRGYVLIGCEAIGCNEISSISDLGEVADCCCCSEGAAAAWLPSSWFFVGDMLMLEMRVKIVKVFSAKSID